ncbi:MAG: menaquinone biosynthesis decarboxylase [Thermodesulfovibrio sp.]|uniref:menaquinone biosynthesis decarboxylase n=1 Tax=unclassified Thermodesulfovibrio TaxID=2645936 RepID=UPI00083A667C|nr:MULTISPECIES: menaquinone biosynthesis decarboxylase [unclassified Thermodesulfovibrio]MDI1471691.1 menaquinone biosynthesis decarboxylase [Thermodesulfovibrio sp. 1176]MDI6713583.1 menaquinone biosynthesis decarboxylase [Thermodesulfovibrio sp.]ODA44281.1 UbiD family decarboxylase associated with menaquinone via futalosine [Thermodesulfovibrio sp. N1]
MAYNDLREFLQVLEKKGLLHRVTVEVDPILEIAEITDRMCKSPNGGKALFFEKVKGSQIPVVTNIFGSFERMCLSLEVESLDDIGKRIEQLLHQSPPKTFKEKIKALFELIEVSKYLPKRVSKAPCQEVINHEPDLNKLPILKTWPNDGGRFITFPMVFTRDPDTGIQNCGMYRMHVYDERTTGMHWHIHKDGAVHYRKYKELGKRMPVAVAIGSDPAVIYSSTAPLPYGVDEMVFAGFLRRKPVEMVKCITSDIEVPANAEIVLEGYVDPHELRDEGPFGDHTGFYSPVDKFPVFHITCITHRKNPIYPATVVGKPPMEDCYMGKATERIFLPLLRMQFPEIRDMNLPMEGVFHNAAIISIKKQYPGHGKKIIHGLWGMGQMSFSKLIIVVDEDVNVQDLSTTAWKVLNNVDWRRDVIISEGPVDELDHASSFPRFGGKMGIDATRKMREEGMMRDWPEEITQAKEIKELVTKRWHEYGF